MKRAAFVAFCMFLAACRTESQAGAVDAGAPFDSGLAFVFADAEPSVAPSAAPALAPIFPESRLAAYDGAIPERLKAIGHTSVVYRIDFAGGLRAAYKPESKRGHKRYRGEVAAYRLAKLLGLPNVPPAEVHVFSREALRAAAQKDARALSLFDDEVVDRKGRVYGSLVPWIDHLQFSPIDSPAERAHWEKELKSGAEIPPDRRSLDAQISTLLAFDVLTGNWDRWSGENVGIDPKTGTLLFIDNDGTFFDPLPHGFEQARAKLREVDRFSRALVTRLRAVSALDLADAFGDEEPGTPLLAARVVAACDERRKEIVALVDEKIASLGEANVLCFP